MTPTVSRMVHYIDSPAAACRAAVITEVTDAGRRDGTIGLACLSPRGLSFAEARFDPGRDAGPGDTSAGLCGSRAYPAGTWHWPARIPEETLS
jgi:hypothetical protein